MFQEKIKHISKKTYRHFKIIKNGKRLHQVQRRRFRREPK